MYLFFEEADFNDEIINEGLSKIMKSMKDSMEENKHRNELKNEYKKKAKEQNKVFNPVFIVENDINKYMNKLNKILKQTKGDIPSIRYLISQEINAMSNIIKNHTCIKEQENLIKKAFIKVQAISKQY